MTPEQAKPQKIDPDKADFILARHHESKYLAIKELETKKDIQSPLRANDQNFDTDLTEEGKKEARQEAIDFFKKFDKTTDAFIFFSSNFVRTIETAKIYLDVARNMGFQVIMPEETGDETVDRVGWGGVKHLKELSLDIKNGLIDQLFNSDKDYLELALERGIELDEELIARWRRARASINQDNKGTWSENWRYYSKEIKKFWPEISTAEEMFDTQFTRLMKLMDYGRKKINAAHYPKKIRVMGFTHENLLTHWLAERWGQPGLRPGELVSFYHDPENNLRAQVRGEDGLAKIESRD